MNALRRLCACLAFLALLLPAAARAEGGTLTLVRGGDSVTLDPARASDSESALAVGQICEGLVRTKDGSLQIEPALALSWTVSPDALAWTFQLRRGVRFHDGSPFTAEAAAASIMRQVDPAHRFHAPGMHTAKSLFEHVAGCDALDEHTLRIRLRRPSASLLFSLATAQAPILSLRALEKWGPEIQSRPVGTGPFLFVEWRRGEALVLANNPDYWGGAPRVDRLVLRTVPDAGARFLEVQSGRADMATGIPPSELAILEKMPKVTALRVPGLNVGYLALNTGRGVFRRAAVRRAVTLALNREALVRLVLGQAAVPAASILPPALRETGFVAEESGARGDPAEARRLLVREGLGQGFEAVLQVMDIPRPYMPEPRRMALAIRQALAGLGIRVKIVTVPWAEYVARATKGEYDMCLTGWSYDAPNPHEFLRYKLGWDSRGNFSHWRDERFQALVNRAEASRDEAERAALLRQALRVVETEAPAVPLAHVRDSLALRQGVQGVVLQPAGAAIRLAKAYREP